MVGIGQEKVEYVKEPFLYLVSNCCCGQSVIASDHHDSDSSATASGYNLGDVFSRWVFNNQEKLSKMPHNLIEKVI